MSTGDTATPTVRERHPVESQRNIGGDMTMSFLVQPDCPSKLPSPDEQHIKGLNAETIAQVFLPPPSWILSPEYAPLQVHEDGVDIPSIFFSLNLAIYGQQILPSEWSECWFLMQGRVHPYALTWELQQLDGSEEDIGRTVNYTIPALIVRDGGYQPIIPRSLVGVDRFPMMQPTVTFTGVIMGSGTQFLRRDALPALTDEQMKCCGFVSLSTYLMPGKAAKPPYGGFHPFQVFIIFPIQAKPWTILCKKMAERTDSQFQTGSTFYCSGKVAGLLDHSLMSKLALLDQDYIFIIVPDSWNFLPPATPSMASHPGPATPAVSTPSKKVTIHNARSQFLTPEKRKSPHTPPAGSASIYTADISLGTRQSQDTTTTPSKRMRTVHASPNSSSLSSTAATDTSDESDELQADPSIDAIAQSPSLSITRGGSSSSRAKRNCQPVKKI